MARPSKTYQGFTRLNMTVDPAFIKDTELSKCVNAIIDRGLVRNMGDEEIAEHSSGNDIDKLPGEVSGYGRGSNLFYFENQYSKTGVLTAGGVKYLVMALNDGSIWWYNYGGTWSALKSSTDANRLRHFSAIDGGLYIGNADHASDAQNLICKPYFRQRFNNNTTYNLDANEGTGSGSDNAIWKTTSMKIAKPIAGALTSGTADDNPTAVATVNSSETPSISCFLRYTETGIIEPEWQKEWYVGVSLMYGKAESKITSLGSVDLTATNVSGVYFHLGIGIEDSSGSDILDPRITGVKLYLREKGSDQWSLHGVWDLNDGGTEPYAGNYHSWTVTVVASGAWARAKNTTDFMELPLRGVFDYFAQTGHGNDIDYPFIGHTGAGYKTGVLIGKTFWVCNTRRYVGGELITQPGRIQPSDPEAYDKFVQEKGWDIALGEGDEIIRADTWGGRLLIWTRTRFVVYNISNPLAPQQEMTLNNMGVQCHGGVFHSDLGIFFANKSGSFLFNNSGLKNLIDGQIPMYSKDSSGANIYESTSAWSDFVPEGAYTTVGFDALSKQLLVTRGADGVAGNIYVWNFADPNMPVGFGDSKFTDNRALTNFVTDGRGKLLFSQYDSVDDMWIYSWNGEPQSTNVIDIAFKDDDFGAPDRMKFVYGVILRYRCSGTAATPVKYALNGFADTLLSNFTTLGTGDLTATNEYVDEWHELAAKVECKSFRLGLRLRNSGLYEIAKVSIDHRIKGGNKVD